MPRLGPVLALFLVVFPGGVVGQNAPREAKPARVTITPAVTEVDVGDTIAFEATAVDETGKQLPVTAPVWFAGPFDLAAADKDGRVTFFDAGEVRVGAVVNGVPGFIRVGIRSAPVSSIEIAVPATPVVAGSATLLTAVARTANGTPRQDVAIEWRSDTPDIASIDPAGMLVGLAPGTARVVARSGQAERTISVDVLPEPTRSLTIEPRHVQARTGDVLRFTARTSTREALTAGVRWSLTGTGATVWQDGAFVAEQPGRYIVTATLGSRTATASVLVTRRQVAGTFEVVGRTPLEDFQTTEQWIIGNYAYAGSFGTGRLWVYDISSPESPRKVDSLGFDAFFINDVSTTPDGRIGVLTREGATSRKNGIVFLDLSDPARPRVASEYTETVTGGVHSAFIYGHHVYLTDDATGSLRVIDFSNLEQPREVARWEVSNPLSQPMTVSTGDVVVPGRVLHDIYAADGLLYLAYWRDGLIILDIGNGIAGGSPTKPAFVSQLRFNYDELYGRPWFAGAHAVFRYKDYIFLGDEVFPLNAPGPDQKMRFAVKGIVHVIDVSDLRDPVKVAEYAVPESGAHNMWVEDDVMYIGYYNGGARAVDVSGELRGDLYRQGREIAHLWTGDPKGVVPNVPFTWGAQPHKGLIYFSDMYSGIWITRLRRPEPESQ